MRKEAGKFSVVLYGGAVWLAGGGGDPFEEEYQCVKRLQCEKRLWFERIQVVHDVRNTERFQEFAECCKEFWLGENECVWLKTYVKTPGSDSVSSQPLESSSDMMMKTDEEENDQLQVFRRVTAT